MITSSFGESQLKIAYLIYIAVDNSIRDKDDHYQAFHNVCRHRAYPVITKPAGSSLILGCQVARVLIIQ